MIVKTSPKVHCELYNYLKYSLAGDRVSLQSLSDSRVWARGSEELYSGTWTRQHCVSRYCKLGRLYPVQKADKLSRFCLILCHTLDGAEFCVPLVCAVLAWHGDFYWKQHKYFLSTALISLSPSMAISETGKKIGNGMPSQWWRCSKMTQKMLSKLHKTQHLKSYKYLVSNAH